MKACTVPDHDRMFVLREARRKLLKEHIDYRCVQSRTEQFFSMPGLGTDRSQNPQVLILGLAHNLRT